MHADIRRARPILAVCVLPLAWGLASTPVSAAACAKPFADARPRGAVASWVTSDDYPQQAMRAGISGPVRFRVNVGADGRVEAVEILEASDQALGQATARLLSRRGRFLPAVRNCQPVPGEYEDVLNWRLPE